MRILRALSTVVAGAVLLAGCSTDVKRQAGADEAAIVKSAPELRIAITAPLAVDPARLNPTHALDVLAADLLYDGLTGYDAQTATATPALAKSWDTPDGVTWIFHLDADRRFSNGTPITSAQVVASLERVRALHDSSLPAGRLDVISTITAPSATDVQIVLTSANYELPALLANPAYGIVADAASDQTVASQTVVSGRFRVQSGGPDAATLVALDNPSRGRGGLSGIEFVHFDDTAAAQDALSAGKVDIAPLGPGDAAPNGSTVQMASAATLLLEISSTNGSLGVAGNHAAVLAALDRSAIVKAVTGDAGDAGRRADSLVPGGVVDPGPCEVVACASDHAAAVATRSLGIVGGPLQLTVAASTASPVRSAGAVGGAEVARQLTEAGLVTEVHSTDSAGLQATVEGGQLQLAMFVMVGAAPSPDPYLSAALSSTGAENLSGYASAAFDQGLATARSTADPVERRAEYRRIEAASLAEAPVIPLVRLGERFAVSDRVTGVRPLAGLLFDATKVGLL